MSDEILNAIRTLIAYAGDDPNRAGVLDTPKRVKSAYNELFKGYQSNALAHINATRYLRKTAKSIEQSVKGNACKEIFIKEIPFTSYCEHHMLPIIGHISLGINMTDWSIHEEDIFQVIEIYARRLQIQEKMNAQIVDDLFQGLEAKAVAGSIQSIHYCMAMRGVNKAGITMTTSHFAGDCSSLSQQIL